MSEHAFMRRVLDALSPKGMAWRPAPGGDLDHLLDGVADNAQATLDDLETLAHLRDPWKVPLELLPDLEREFGIAPNTALTVKTRRANLSILRYRKGRKKSSLLKLQAALDRAGFGAGGYGLVVTPNASPAVDPTQFVDRAFVLTCHEEDLGARPLYPQAGQICARAFDGSDALSGEQCAGHYTEEVADPSLGSRACCGDEFAYCCLRGGYYLVNGDKYTLTPAIVGAGQICARAFDGSDALSGEQCAGHYSAYNQYSNEYATPAEAYWSLIFYVGGNVTRDADTDAIVDVAPVYIPSHRRQELNRLILRFKPLGTWAAMCVQYN